MLQGFLETVFMLEVLVGHDLGKKGKEVLKGGGGNRLGRCRNRAP